MMSHRIVILGSNGHIGRAIINILSHKYELLALNSFEVDVLNKKQLVDFARKQKDSICINLSYRHLENDSPSQVYDYNVNMINNIRDVSQYFYRLIQLGSFVENLSPNDSLFFKNASFMDLIYRETKLYAYNKLSMLPNCSYLKLAPCFGADFFIDKFIKRAIVNHMNVDYTNIKYEIKSHYLYIYDFVKILDFVINSSNNLTCDLCNNDYISRNDIIDYINNNKSLDDMKMTLKCNYCSMGNIPIVSGRFKYLKYKSIFSYIRNLCNTHSVSKYEF